MPFLKFNNRQQTVTWNDIMDPVDIVLKEDGQPDVVLLTGASGGSAILNTGTPASNVIPAGTNLTIRVQQQSDPNNYQDSAPHPFDMIDVGNMALTGVVWNNNNGFFFTAVSRVYQEDDSLVGSTPPSIKAQNPPTALIGRQESRKPNVPAIPEHKIVQTNASLKTELTLKNGKLFESINDLTTQGTSTKGSNLMLDGTMVNPGLMHYVIGIIFEIGSSPATSTPRQWNMLGSAIVYSRTGSTTAQSFTVGLSGGAVATVNVPTTTVDLSDGNPHMIEVIASADTGVYGDSKIVIDEVHEFTVAGEIAAVPTSGQVMGHPGQFTGKQYCSSRLLVLHEMDGAELTAARDITKSLAGIS